MEHTTDNTKHEKKYPEPTVGPIIYNNEGEILLIKCPKWGDYWHIPGGHIETGETGKEALKREVKEETNLEIDNIEFIGWQDAINPVGFFKKKHFIFLDFSARLAGGEIKESREMSEYRWIKPEEALKVLKIDPRTVKTINFYLNHKNKREINFEHKYKRALADYQNLLKQTAREKEEFAKFANEQLIMEILPVYDNLKLTLTHADSNGLTRKDSDLNGWLDGINHIVRQFKNVLENIGVEEIKTAGEKFDPNTMEAVSEEETDDDKKDGIVVSELSAGYKLKGKVIRAARVAVYKMKHE